MTLKSPKKLLAFTVAFACGVSSSSVSIYAKANSGSGAKAGGGSGTDAAACRSCVSQAASLFASNELDMACALLRQWSGKCPRNAQLHLLLSTILIRLGEKFAGEAEQEAALACAAQDDSQAAHLQYAMTLLAGQKYVQSAREFEVVTNLNPGSYEAWAALSELYKRLRKEDDAAKAAEKAAILEPSTQIAKLAVLHNLKKNGHLVQAHAELKKLLSESKAAPEMQQLLANEAIQLGAYDEAIEACNSVIAAYPNSAGPLKCLFIAQFLKRKYSDAEANAAKVLASQKDKSAEVLGIRALCHLHEGRTSEAERDFKSAQAADSSSAFVMLADGMLKLSKGNFAEAADSLKSASEAAYSKDSQADRIPQSLAHLALCRLNRKEGLIQEAQDEAHAAASDKRFLAAARALEARADLADPSCTDALATASKLAQQAISADSAEPEALLAQSFCQLQSGKVSEAKLGAEKAAQQAPAEGDALLLLAQIAARNNDVATQQQELDKGLGIAPNDPELLYQLGQLYLKSNKAAEAVQALKQAIACRVRGPEICFALAVACEKSGNSSESLKYYKQSLSQGLNGDSSNQAKAAINRLETNK